MARFEHISIFQSAYILTLEIYKTTKNFSKEYKYTLGERLKNISHEILDLVMKTNATTNAWNIHLSNGNTGLNTKTFSNYVVCVR